MLGVALRLGMQPLTGLVELGELALVVAQPLLAAVQRLLAVLKPAGQLLDRREQDVALLVPRFVARGEADLLLGDRGVLGDDGGDLHAERLDGLFRGRRFGKRGDGRLHTRPPWGRTTARSPYRPGPAGELRRNAPAARAGVARSATKDTRASGG